VIDSRLGWIDLSQSLILAGSDVRLWHSLGVQPTLRADEIALAASCTLRLQSGDDCAKRTALMVRRGGEPVSTGSLDGKLWVYE
jgi:hypothetical protein